MADSAALEVRDRLEGRVRAPRATAEVDANDQAILKEARDRWNRCDESENEQRKSILQTKRFRSGDQWDAAIKLSRQGAQAIQGQAAQPARPTFTIDRLSQPVRQVSNTIKNARFGFNVVPNGGGSDTDTAEIFKGMLRHMQNKARGESPVEWAADGAIEGGLGWFRLRTDYVTEAPQSETPTWEDLTDQELVMERIANSLSVYCDPGASKPTRSDALFMFVTEDMSRDEFDQRFPDAKSVEGIEDFAATGDQKKWLDKDMVRIAEYWRIRFEDEKWLKIGATTHKVADFPPKTPATAKRVLRRPIVEGFKINAIEILERWDWIGSRIPLIPVLGEELNVGGKPVLRGMIQSGIDAQIMVNYSYSAAIEETALGIKAKVMVPAQGIAGFEQYWETANKYNYAYLPYNQFDEMGRPINPPVVPPAQSNVSAQVELMQISEECVKATTGYFDSGLGADNQRTQSGRAKQSEIQQSELGSSNYPANVERALIYAAELALEIIPKITRVGQIVNILGTDDEPQQVMVGAPFQQGPDGQPMPSPLSPEEIKAQQNKKDALHKFYDLRAGRYSVTVKAGKADATKREEGAAALGDLIPHLPPEMAMVATPDYVEQLDFPNSHKIAEKLRKALPPQLQGQEEGGADPKKQALQQQVQQLQQAIQSKQAEKQAEVQAKGQIDLQKTQLQESAESQRQADENRLAIMKAEIAANAQIAVAEVKAGSEDLNRRLKLIELYLTANQEARLDKEAHMHELGTQMHDQAHEVGVTAMQHTHEKDMAQLGHQQALEQGVQQAALEPPQEPAS